MNYKVICTMMLLMAIKLAAQNQVPVVNNVTFSQRTNGSFIVDVYYDVNDADGDQMTVSMEVSEDAGQTYTLTADLVSGDIGSGITSGSNKHIVWDFGTDHPNYSSDKIQIKILADDGQGGGFGKCGDPIEYAGKTYNTVQIGSQCWLKENLDVGTMIESNSGGDNQTDNGTIEKYCYNNDENNCGTYGGLYQWNEAMQYVTTERTQGICPSGWHIPTDSEQQTLSDAVGGDGNALKAIGQGFGSGVGTNTSGFSALLAGHRYVNTGVFYDLGSYTYFLSSTEDGSSAHSMSLSYYNDNVFFGNFHEYYGFSVRCLKD